MTFQKTLWQVSVPDKVGWNRGSSTRYSPIPAKDGYDRRWKKLKLLVRAYRLMSC